MDPACVEELKHAHQLKVDGVLDTPGKAQLQADIRRKYYGPPAASGEAVHVCNGHMLPMQGFNIFMRLSPRRSRAATAAEALTPSLP